jgi:DEAD/DEAH box helicase domain-containing protein
LELGVDIGGLDSVILDGYPGTLMQAYQRAGRAGRGEDESLVALVASDNPLDQYIMANPSEFFSKDPEEAVVNPQNESIMKEHLCAAAQETPLRTDDKRFFGGKLDGVASNTRNLSRRNSRWVYTGNESPQHNMSIRSINDVTVEIKTTSNRTIAELDFESALRDVHPGAYYFHQGEKYKVKSLDLDDYVATVTPTSDRHITRVVRRKEIYVNEELREKSLSSNINIKFADLGVSTRFPEYAVVDRKSDEVIEKVDLNLPSSQIQTKGLYFSVPPGLLDKVSAAGDGDDTLPGLHAAEHALISMFPLEVLCDRRDIGGLSIEVHPYTESPTIFIHGAHRGGVGICSAAYDSFETIISRAHNVVNSCSCSGGCPSCVYSPHCGNLNEDLSKPKAETLLDSMQTSIN